MYRGTFSSITGTVLWLKSIREPSRKELVKKWYDGFTFGKVTDIYNPWSIISYLDKKEFNTYWANTSSNSLINKLIREGIRMIRAG